MQLLAFDGRMGASGDMLLAALLAAGADPQVLAPVEEALGVEYRIERVDRAGISATNVAVVNMETSSGDAAQPASGSHDHAHHRHDHGDHDHSHEHTHHGEHDHAEGGGPHRSYQEVISIVESMGLPDTVEGDALAIFKLLGEAEAAVHGTELKETHFHEVGADDAIADVVGVALLVAEFNPDRIVTTPLSTGGGEVDMAHGRYPVPTPAVVELAETADWDLRGGPVEAELLTPTGAAILAYYADGVDILPSMRIRASGYGAGDRTIPDHPNVLRAIGGTATGELTTEDITVLETNLDDASPEVLGNLQESLLESGARDVTLLPTTMKKARPGHLIKVIVKPEDAQRVAKRLARETGTLGIRAAGASHRWIADRRFVTTTLLEAGTRHEVRVKIASDDTGEVFDVSAEFDEAKAVADATGLPVREVLRRAEAAARQGGAVDPVLVHVIEADRWTEVASDGTYAPQSLDTEGFIHLSPVNQIPGVAQYNYPDADDPQLLLIDREMIEADVKYEEMPTGAYPHLYRPLAADEVDDVIELPREDGRFVFPDSLRNE